jgi:hypothetical protein
MIKDDRFAILQIYNFLVKEHEKHGDMLDKIHEVFSDLQKISPGTLLTYMEVKQ